MLVSYSYVVKMLDNTLYTAGTGRRATWNKKLSFIKRNTALINKVKHLDCDVNRFIC